MPQIKFQVFISYCVNIIEVLCTMCNFRLFGEVKVYVLHSRDNSQNGRNVFDYFIAHQMNIMVLTNENHREMFDLNLSFVMP